MSPSSRSTPSRRTSFPSDSMSSSHPPLSDPFNTPLCSPIPEPYLLNPLTIGPLDGSSIKENDAAHHRRRRFFHALNETSKHDRPASYNASALGWLPIYWNAGWAAWLRELGHGREEDARSQGPTREIRSGAEQSEIDEDDAVLERKRVLDEVEEDAREFVPDTDLEAPLQEILKDMYWEYIVEEEVRRRVARLDGLRRRRMQLDGQASRGECPPAILVAASEVKRTRGHRGRVPRMPGAVDPDKGIERMMQQLTTFAEYLDEEGC